MVTIDVESVQWDTCGKKTEGLKITKSKKKFIFFNSQLPTGYKPVACK